MALMYGVSMTMTQQNWFVRMIVLMDNLKINLQMVIEDAMPVTLIVLDVKI